MRGEQLTPVAQAVSGGVHDEGPEEGDHHNIEPDDQALPPGDHLTLIGQELQLQDEEGG